MSCRQVLRKLGPAGYQTTNMSDPAYKDPDVNLGRIYTKRGDRGETSLVGGTSVPKDHLRIEAYGTVDELNSFIGVARVSADEAAAAGKPLAALSRILLRVQHELFNLGSILATEPDQVRPQQPQIAEADIEQLEREIDRANVELPSLPSFVASVARLRALAVRRVLPGHGAPVEGEAVGRLFERFERHHSRRSARVRALLEARPDTAYGVVGRLFPHLPETRLSQAMTEVIGQLDVLVARGEAVAERACGVLVHRAPL